MKPYRTDIVRASSIAIGIVLVITVLWQYVIPPYIFVSPGYSVYVAGVVDHKKIGQGYNNGQSITWYTVSIRLFNDDPINGIHAGETVAYIVPKTDWEMIEWGDTIKVRLKREWMEAETVELYPSPKIPEWRGLSSLKVEFNSNKLRYHVGEKAYFNVKITYTPEEGGYAGPSPSMTVTLFKALPFWAFIDGRKVFTSNGNRETQETILQPSEQRTFSLEWNLADDSGATLSEGIYYVRVYMGYLTYNEEDILTGTTMLEVKS